MYTSFDFKGLLKSPNHIILSAKDETQLSRLKASVREIPKTLVGIIDQDFPFLSNLDMIENITLGDMYTNRIGLSASKARIAPMIQALGMEKVVGKRKELLTRGELLKCHVLRCLASNNQAVFMEYPKIWEVRLLIRALEMAQCSIRLWISCHEKSMRTYDGLGFETFHLPDDV